MRILSTISAIDLKIPPQDAGYALKDKSHLCFLDNSLTPNEYSIFSYITWNPKLIIKSHGYKNEFTSFAGRMSYYSYQHPLSFLKQNIKDYTYSPPGSEIKKIDVVYIDNRRAVKVTKKVKEKLPYFLGGFAGYFSYDLKNHIEKLPCRAVDDINLPLFYLAYYDRLLAYNHQDSRWYFIRNFPMLERKVEDSRDDPGTVFQEDDYIFPGTGNMDLVRKISKDIEDIKGDLKEAADIKSNIIKKYYKKNISNVRLHSNLTMRNYIKRVLKTKEYIHNGDIYQANFRPRGKDKTDDNKNMMELKNSIKDRAELNMIVDLERNDIGKFCYYGTVKVSGHAVIEKFAKVFHSVSTVTGRAKKGVDVSNIIKAAFPGGSITGAPKIRAMEIIDELEPVARNIYTGSIGYIGIDSTMDLNIVIRTFIIKGNKFYYNVGGGIVEDSIPEEEYKESLDKGIALEETLKFFIAKNLKKLI